jgi:hypothetical protein
MLRRLQWLLVLGSCVIAVPAAAGEGADPPASAEDASRRAPLVPQADAPKPAEGSNAPSQTTEPTQPPATPTQPAEAKSVDQPGPPRPLGLLEGWQTFITGYFRAPLALGVSSRPGPDDPNGPARTQLSYGPNRTVDSNYYSFAYERLQEQDWVELFTHVKHKHAEAVIGWMGYWLQAATSFRNPDAAWIPGMAYLTLDTDFRAGPVQPNIALTMGAWWPKFGYFEKYDTYTLGRFRQMGEQLKLTVPATPDWTITVLQGIGIGRDGSFNYSVTPLYQSTVGADLITYENVEVTYKDYVDVSIHYNNMWSTDPNLTQQTNPVPKSFQNVQDSNLSVIGAEVNVSAPYAGHLWVSPSYIHVRNGWALGAGTEVMHGLGGSGVATNYLAWNNVPEDSTGTGTVLNLGVLYENSLSRVLRRRPGDVMPEVTLSAFALITKSKLDLPAGSTLPQKGLVNSGLTEFKYGADVTVQPLTWLGFMLRFDTVQMDSDQPGYIYAAITPRLIVSSHFLSGETVYLQYSRYFYGDNILLNPIFPWQQPLVPGASVLQEGPYSGKKPDTDVIKMQATIAF